MDRWKGRVALVTGASAGIGAGLCRALVQHGMTVVGCARSVDRIKAIAEEDALKDAPGKLVAIKCDLTKESEILSMFDEIRRTLGRLDVCINNAGIGYDASLLTGECDGSLYLYPTGRKADAGKSIVGHKIPNPGMGSFFYCGTKHMLRALTEGLRKELKATNSHIRIGSICPGIVETEFFANYSKTSVEEASAFFKSFDPLRPKDIADSVLYILSAPPHVEVHDILIQPIENSI
ncbi:unnamed protein product [Larinioides sclopetarius]|uniref:Dehydrogenase/reductase SDR family member 11 n=1 Tax=Larinioides sclopetarius TaxID=280406 RepID=A0AAV1YQQ9_9ARAC